MKKKPKTAEEKYLENRLACIHAVIFGGIVGAESVGGMPAGETANIIYKHVKVQTEAIIKYLKRKTK